MGIYILYSHEIEYNYVCGKRGKGLYWKWEIREEMYEEAFKVKVFAEIFYLKVSG